MNIALQSSIHIVLLQRRKLLCDLLPIFKGTTHVDVLDPAANHESSIIEILLEGVHDDRCGKDIEEFVC